MLKLISMVLMVTFVTNFAMAQDAVPDADAVLEAAYRQANAENKNIFVIFQASWCGWCHKMEKAMNDKESKKIFESNYVIVHLDVEESKDKKDFENPGADAIKKKYNGEKSSLPFWLVLDKNGKLLADSYIRKAGPTGDQPSENIGCPSNEKEIEMFIAVIKRTSSLSESKLATIAKRFRKNKQTID